MQEINGIWGDLIVVLANISALLHITSVATSAVEITTSEDCLAKVSLRPPRKVLIFIAEKNVFGSRYPNKQLMKFKQSFTQHNL